MEVVSSNNVECGCIEEIAEHTLGAGGGRLDGSFFARPAAPVRAAALAVEEEVEQPDADQSVAMPLDFNADDEAFVLSEAFVCDFSLFDWG
jgi:hypothetical protein